MRTGKEGWFKRVNRHVKSVSKQATLTDDYEIDPSRDVASIMFNAAKSSVLHRPKASWLCDLDNTVTN